MLHFLLFELGVRGIFKTIWFNLRYLTIKQGIRLPVLLSKETIIDKCYRGGIVIDSPLSFAMIRIGFAGRTMLDIRPCRLYVQGKLIFRGKAKIGVGTRIHIIQGGELELGNNFALTGHCFFDVRKNICWGDNCLVSYENIFMDNDGEHKIYDQQGKRINEHRKIAIGNHVWIGARCTILKGSEIPDDVVIASNSVVVGQISLGAAIYAGEKAEFVKDGIRWEK